MVVKVKRRAVFNPTIQELWRISSGWSVRITLLCACRVPLADHGEPHSVKANPYSVTFSLS